MNTRLFKNGKIERLTTLRRNVILYKTNNPGAMFSINQITILNDENRTFSNDEIVEIGILIEKENDNVNKS